MPHPKKRTNSSKRDKRRSHHALKAKQVVACKNCKKPTLPHVQCDHCGK